MSVQPMKLLLYVASQGPNSRLAIANLQAMREKHLPPGSEVEIVDVFEQPERALKDGVILTPLLTTGPHCRIVGNLSATAEVLSALGLNGATK